ncbi:MAG: glycoside hydrolase family 3 C-terminal domain-containing protein [Promethearchaeota archaeon]
MAGEKTPVELSKLPFMDATLDLEERVDDLLGRLTLEEKFSLSAGKGLWTTKPVKRLGIPKFKMTDGPHGVGAFGSWFKKCTYFPTAVCRASTWNPGLSEQFGQALAEEVRAIGYQMILAPGVNIDRTPLCGRTFEYQTEDPHLNSRLAVAVVKGVQAKRVAACVKHYACNNQETWRRTVDVRVGERALREIYLPAFEAVVREADAWSLMACYNKVNGQYGCENADLLVRRLGEWGFRGFVVSDWFAAKPTTSTGACVDGGLSLEMPGKGHKFKVGALRAAFEAGEFDEATLDRNLRRLLRVYFLVGTFDHGGAGGRHSRGSRGKDKRLRNTPEHQALARKIAGEGIVLLKNESGLLPISLESTRTLAVVGPNAKRKSGLGGGSSMVRPPYEVTALRGIREKCHGRVEVVKDPASADAAVVVVGLAHKFFKSQDCEGKDKRGLALPAGQVDLIRRVSEVNPRTVVVLVNGSPVSMEGWLDGVAAVVEGWYWGQEGGRALADILFGDVNPSGKLPLTFPRNLEDSPAHVSQRTYPGTREGKRGGPVVHYDEGVFVGYRHFDARGIEPLFPFGHGLSYTSFSLGNLELDATALADNGHLSASVDITNTGQLPGAEVVQLYLEDVEASVPRPPRELKGFQKVFLGPGEGTTVTLALGRTDLSFFDEESGSWVAEPGEFRVHIGASSRDIRGSASFEYTG